MLTNQRMEKIDRNGIKDLERFTRKLYIYRQKDRLQDEREPEKKRRYLKNEIIN